MAETTSPKTTVVLTTIDKNEKKALGQTTPNSPALIFDVIVQMLLKVHRGFGQNVTDGTRIHFARLARARVIFRAVDRGLTIS